jgi:hypothetical protein
LAGDGRLGEAAITTSGGPGVRRGSCCRPATKAARSVVGRRRCPFTSDPAASCRDGGALDHLPDSDVTDTLQRLLEDFRLVVYLADVEGSSYPARPPVPISLPSVVPGRAERLVDRWRPRARYSTAGHSEGLME